MKTLKRELIVRLLPLSLLSCSGTETTTPNEVDLVDAVFASGYTIKSNEYLVTANTEGYLIHSLVEEGDQVVKNTPLFQLSSDVQSQQLANAKVLYQDALNDLKPDDPAIQQLEFQIQQAIAQRDLDQKNKERYERLRASGAVSQKDVDMANVQYQNSILNVSILEQSLADLKDQLSVNLDNAKTQLLIQQENNNDYYLTSSINGMILQVFREEGELVKRGEPVAKIGGGNDLIKLFVGEEDINKIAVGQKVVVSLNTDPNAFHEAYISKIFPTFDDTDQSFIVEAVFDKHPGRLFSNTQLQANIIVYEQENALVIPSRFILEGDSVLLRNGKLGAVKVGVRSGDWTEILAGIEAGQTILLPKR